MSSRGFEDLDRNIKRLAVVLQTRVPKLLANAAERHYKGSFNAQGFTDQGLRKWRPTKTGKPGRILKKTSLLYQSVRAEAVGMVINVRAGGPHVPYAKIHNEGGTIQRQATRRAHERRAHARRAPGGKVQVKAHRVARHQVQMNVHLPKRQFIGPSQALNKRMREIIIQEMRAIIKRP